MIEIRNLCMSFGEEEVFKNISFDVPEHGICAIIAPSGSGKTTLLRVLAGLETPDSGTVSGVPSKISYVFQEQRLLPWFSALENVALVANTNSAVDAATELLASLGITAELARKRPAQLSGGERQRVCLARALLFGGDLLLLDEPLVGLDTANKAKALALIKVFAKTKPVILVSHQQDDLALANTAIRI